MNDSNVTVSISKQDADFLSRLVDNYSRNSIAGPVVPAPDTSTEVIRDQYGDVDRYQTEANQAKNKKDRKQQLARLNCQRLIGALTAHIDPADLDEDHEEKKAE